jgi:pimeloyl-ACP methyl ester carboxylesterase
MMIRSVLTALTAGVALAALTTGCGGAAAENPRPAAEPAGVVAEQPPQLPDQGESTAQLAGKFPGAQLGAALDTVPFPLADRGTGNDLYIKPDEFQKVFAADVPRDVTALMAATQRPIAAAALEEPATKTAWKTIPSWNMITTEDLAIPAESMRFMGERAKSHNVEIKASHAVTVSQPDAVAELIGEAANATAG